ncbi:hypothetical protein K439DRAFT_1657311 [Ramaria rubella]|nr:hypothetical protein K439DRAFT_1657311 [Ramaria rubella]
MIAKTKVDDLQPSGSGPPTKTRRLFKTVSYPASPEEHEELDAKVLKYIFKEHGSLSLFAPGSLLATIVAVSPLLNQKYTNPLEALDLLEAEDGLTEELQKAWDSKHFTMIRDLVILHPLESRAKSDSAYISKAQRIEASADAWQSHYESGVDKMFLQTINTQYNDTSGKMYAHHIAVVQSSGTGKSRMLHEVSRSVFTVIMNLGSRRMNGASHPFFGRCDFHDCLQVRAIANQFLIALFEELATLSLESPAELREYLGYGDRSRVKYREAFFHKVIETAKKMQVTQPVTPPKGTASTPPLPFVIDGEKRNMQDAASTLIKLMRSKTQVNLQPNEVVFILGFDEASELSSEHDASEDMFVEICRALWSIREHPIYGVFMSTAGPLRQFHPCLYEEGSSRIQKGQLCLWPPFTLVGYDQLARPLNKNSTLDDATNIDFMLSLGRPLFKTRYEKGTKEVKEGIVDFARTKLMVDGDNMPSKIAPLVTRLPLTFNALTETGREAEQRQVEAHMRICLNILPESDVMYTVAPSEPILVEAAAAVMQEREVKSPGNSVRVLQDFLSNRYLSKGDRGELVCMLLMLLAHDETVRSLKRQLHPTMKYHTPITVKEFLTCLFAETHHKTIFKAQVFEDGPTLEEALGDSWMHFTHFIKATDHKVVNRQFLARAMARGAAILCADNQLGIDAIVPYCYKGNSISPDNMGVLAIQSRNVFNFHWYHPWVFANMHPKRTGVFNAKSQDIPVINIVFSVGVSSATFQCLPLMPCTSET